MRILITGSNGLLGQKLVDLLAGRSDIELIATSRGANRLKKTSGYTYANMDITNLDQVLEVFSAHKPQAVIHGAAMTHVDQCELHPEDCRLMNVKGTANVVAGCQDQGAYLAFISTDFIFDGTKGPYLEDAEPNPLSVYGHSKLDAESIVMSSALQWSILRTVLVYGMADDLSRSNIILWAKDALDNNKPIQVVDDQFRTPTLAEDLAQGCYLAVAQKAQGVYNISGDQFVSIYELVERVAKHWGLSMESVTKVNSTTLAQPAKRPPVTGFIVDKAKRDLGYQPHSLEEGFEVVHQQYLKQVR